MRPVRGLLDRCGGKVPAASALAGLLLAVVLCGWAMQTGVRVVFASRDAVVEGAFCVSALVLVLWLHLGFLGRPPGAVPAPMRLLALLAQATLTYLPLLWFGGAWLSVSGVLGAGALLALRGRVALPVALSVIGTTVPAELFLSPASAAIRPLLHDVVSTTVTVFVVYGLTRMRQLLSELGRNGDELARLAVAEERERFSRDVHDLLGLSLSAITVKSELTRRLMTEQPLRATVEIGEVLDLSRKALADVRVVANGYRRLRFDEECRSAKAVLAAAGVDVDLHVDLADLEGRQLPPEVDAVLAIVLREGVTNVLRHTSARWATIRLLVLGDRIHLDIVNDGVETDRAAGTGNHGDGRARGGCGLANLSHRVLLLGGELAAAADAGGRHRLTAAVPLRRAVTASGPAVP